MRGSKSKINVLSYKTIENQEYFYLEYLHFYFNNYIPELVSYINNSKNLTINKKVNNLFYSYLIKVFGLPLYFDSNFSYFVYEVYDAYICFYLKITKSIRLTSSNIDKAVLKKRLKKTLISFILNIIYDDKSENFKVLAIILVAVPNGQLKKIYKDNIIGAGKSKGKSFRYEYKENPYFQLIKEKPLRIKSLYIDPQYKESYFTNIK